MAQLGLRTCYIFGQKWIISKKLIRVGNLIKNYEILTTQEKEIAHIVNKMNRGLEMNAF